MEQKANQNTQNSQNDNDDQPNKTLPQGIIADENKVYIIRLQNGDLLTGKIVETFNDPEEGEGIRFKTEIGKAVIYASQIVEIKLKDDFYKYGHRVFLLPTAEPVKNFFIGDFEALFLYTGIGISDVFSVTLGHTMIPAIPANQQFSVIDTKFSLFNVPFEEDLKDLKIAVGANLAFLNSDNRLVHYYGAATFDFPTTSLTANIFYKAGSKDNYDLQFSSSHYLFSYPDGNFGIGLGFDTELSKNHGLHCIGELWNSDVSKPSNSGVLLGMRLAGSTLAADFGIAFFTKPFWAPFFSFVWTP